ncbi:DUF72 domain-containing protein [Gelidibacter japonicus]|uniref:DUF72 domain-containing protein n=1 Tax=Gelidibacter japonicus TaxID=1962232 RepID=UPI003A93E52D
MKFGKVANPETIDFSLPKDFTVNGTVLSGKKKDNIQISIGYPKWNKQQLSGFYPKKVKDELTYYATQLNAIELNATYYRNYSPEQYQKWADKVPDDFRFYPKISQSISRYRKLIDVDDRVEYLAEGLGKLGDKLGMAFLQMDNFFSPDYFKNLEKFIVKWPKQYPLAVELRHKDWFNSKQINDEVYHLFKENKVTHVLTDTHERRDILHMKLTTPHAFIRFVDAEHALDYERLDDWVRQLKIWINNGLEGVHFFIHRKERSLPKSIRNCKVFGRL